MLLFKWIRSFSPSARSFLSFLNGVCFILPKLPLFSRPPTLFLQELRFLNHVSLLFVRSLFIRFFQCSYPVILKKILTELQVYYSSFSFLLRWIQFKRCQAYPFPVSNVFPCRCTSYLLTFLYFFSGVLKIISENSCFHSQSIQVILRLLSHSSHLIQPVHPPFSINHATVFSFEWALTHRSFPRILPDSSNFSRSHSQILFEV